MKSAVCMIVKNEERLAPEWIAYHLALGFDACLVYDNASTDRTADIVRRAARLGDVRLTNWDVDAFSYQIEAYEHALGTFGGEFEWIAFVDSDEFICSPTSDHIANLFETAGGGSGIALNWAVFGSSGRLARPDGLVIESYLSRAPDDFGPNHHTKMVINTRSTVRFLNPHAADLDGFILDASGDRAQWASPGATVRFLVEPWRVNHDFTRSREEWDLKLARGYHDVIRNSAEFALMDRNEVEDAAMLRFVDRVRDGIAVMALGSPV